MFVRQCFVLTAGHCMSTGQNLNDVNVYLGRHIRSSGGTKYGVKEATFHPGWLKAVFKPGTLSELSFDLLLLCLDKAVTFSNIISPVCLPTKLEDRDAKPYNCTANGCVSFFCYFFIMLNIF